MTDSNGHASDEPLPQQVLISSDGVRVTTQANVPMDVCEGLLMRALEHCRREILVMKLTQFMAVRDEQARVPRIHLPGAPV